MSQEYPEVYALITVMLTVVKDGQLVRATMQKREHIRSQPCSGGGISCCCERYKRGFSPQR